MRPTMAFPSAPSVLWSVSLLTVLFAAAVHSNIVFGKHISPYICLSLWASDLPTLSLSLWWCPLSVDSRHFRCFLCYDKGITEPLITAWDTPGSPGPGGLPHGSYFSFCLSTTSSITYTHSQNDVQKAGGRTLAFFLSCSAAQHLLCLSHRRDDLP